MNKKKESVFSTIIHYGAGFPKVETCRFLKPHNCAGCQDEWRCEGATPPFVIENNIEACFSDEYVGCPHYKAGLEVRDLANELKLEQKKRDRKIEIAMMNLEGLLSEEPTLETQLIRLKGLYRSRLVDLHEYKASLRRCKEALK